MKKTLVWRFERQKEVIQTLHNDKTIDVKFWINALPIGEKEYNFYYFLNESWIDVYREKFLEYTKGVKFNHEVYTKVYSKIYECIQMNQVNNRYFDKPFHWFVNMFNLMYNFFYAVMLKEQIELVMFVSPPHTGADLVIYEVAKAMGIKTLMFMPTHFKERFFYYDSPEDYGDFSIMKPMRMYEHIKIEKKHEKNIHYMKNLKHYSFSFAQLIKQCQSFSLENTLNNFLKLSQRYVFYREFRKNSNKHYVSPDLSLKYVYFPLHNQPELSTCSIGEIYCDQILALERLDALLPDDWLIYVKESPIQGELMRPSTFYKRFGLIKKARLVERSFSTYELLENAQLLSTITGTAGWEAITGGKPALIFGNAWYKNFPGVEKYSENTSLDHILNTKIEHEEVENTLSELSSKMAEGIIHEGWEKVVPDYNPLENILKTSNSIRRIINDL